MKQEAGFSLIELMVVVAIVGILAVIGLPSYNIWVQNTRVHNAAESILNGLQLARSEAVARNANIDFVLTDTASSWILGCVVVDATTCPAVIQRRAASEGSGDTVATINNASVANTVRFSNLGTLVNALGGMTIDVDSTVLSSSDSRELRIQIGAGGSVRMCDPNVGSDDPRKC